MSWSVPSAFLLNMPAGTAALSAIAGLGLPTDYLDFLSQADGGEGFLHNDAYVVLWRAEEIVPFNRDYEVQRYAPEVILFGADGGGEMFGFDRRAHDMPVVQLPAIGLAMKEALHRADSFSALTRYTR